MGTPTIDLEEGAIALLDATPDASLMEEYAQETASEFLKGAGKFSLDNANLEDSREYMEIIVSNIAEAKGNSLSSAQVKALVSKPFSELSSADRNTYETAITVSSAQTGLDVAEGVSGSTYQLYSVTSGVLEDGRLSISEAVNLGATAVSMASAFLAGFAGGAALGPIGAIAGLIMGGINILGSQRAASRAYWEAREAFGKEVAEAMIGEADEYLADQQRIFLESRQLAWEARDSAIAELADAWAAYEDELGVRFGLRYFPGSMIPPRAGFFQKVTRFWESGNPEMIVKWYRVRSEGVTHLRCEDPAGCLYFPEPHPSRVAALGRERAFEEMLQGFAASRKFLTTQEDASNIATGEDYALPPADPELAYYSRAIRACDAFVPFDSTTGGRYWLSENERVANQAWKNGEDIAFEWFCWSADQAKSNVAACRNKEQYTLGGCLERKSCHYPSNYQRQGREAVAAFFKFNDPGENPSREPDIVNRSVDFAAEMFDALNQMDNSTDVIKTRVLSDLVQTANAVRGEMVTSTRIMRLFEEMGTSDLSVLSAADLRSFNAVDEATRQRLDLAKKRDTAINAGMLVAGVGALGLGGYRKWGKR